MRKAYQSDLCDAEWSCLEPHLPGPKATGRPKLHSTREIINAIFYLRRSRRLCLATAAQRLPTLEDRLALLPLLAFGWDLGEDACRPTPAG